MYEEKVEGRLGAIAGFFGFALYLWFSLISQDLIYAFTGMLFLIAMVAGIYALRTKKEVTQDYSNPINK